MIKESNNVDSLINWGEVSRRLSGSRCVILRNKIPQKHVEKVEKLRSAIDSATQEWYKNKK